MTAAPREIFVFGSNLAGRHGRGAALHAHQHHGAELGVGLGRTGDAWAIPTKDAQLRTLPLDQIEAYVGRFLAYARNHPELIFKVTAIGTGLAGHKHEHIAPMFARAPTNCRLPEEWRRFAPCFPAGNPSRMPRVLNKKTTGVPRGAVYIGRPSKWGNPFVIGKHGTRAEVVAKYRAYLLGSAALMAALPEFAGKDLVCWCAPQACHGDVLIELANAPEPAKAPAVLGAAGHRPARLGDYGPETEARLVRLARDHLEAADNTRAAISGMALGWDTAWALAAVELGIPLIAAVPFDGQERRSPESARCLHARLLSRAARIELVSPGPYAPWKFERRNEWMVDHADRIVALWTGAPGGTARCVAYAQRSGRPVDNLWARWQALGSTP